MAMQDYLLMLMLSGDGDRQWVSVRVFCLLKVKQMVSWREIMDVIIWSPTVILLNLNSKYVVGKRPHFAFTSSSCGFLRIAFLQGRGFDISPI